MSNQSFSMPGAGGGLIRYSEEYKSRFMLSPSHVIVFIILIILFVFILNIFYPVSG